MDTAIDHRIAESAGRSGTVRRRIASAIAAHEHRTAAGLLALLVLAYLHPVLLGGHTLLPVAGLYYDAPWAGLAPHDLTHYVNRSLEDVTGSYYPWDVLARRLLHAGTFPAWNPHALAGTPFFANFEVAWLSPFSLPLWLLPLHWALGFAAALKLWAAGFGTYLLVRELRLGFWPGMLAGVCFALCAFNVVWLSHGVHVSVAALLPWMLWLVERLVRRGRPVDAFALAAVVACAVASGHPGTLVHALSAVVLYGLMRAAASGDVAVRERARRLGLVGVALALGVLVTAVVLLPAQQAAVDTAGALARSEGSVEFAGTRMSREILRTALFPDWWGRPSEGILRGPAAYNERTFYTGTVALLLALVGLASRGGWRRKAPYLALALVGIGVAVRVPIVHGLVAELPLFDRVQNQRMLLWTELAIAVLGAFGLQAVLDRPRRWQTWAVLAVAALAAVAAIAALHPEVEAPGQALHYLLHRSGEVTEASLALAGVGWWAVFAAALAVVLAVGWIRPRASRVVGALVVLVAALDMLHFSHGYQPMPPASKVPPPRTPAIAYLRRHSGEGRAGALQYAMFGDFGTVYGLRDVRGYDQPQPSLRFFQLWRVGEPQQTPGGAYLLFRTRLQLLGLFGMRYLLSAPEGQIGRESFLTLAYRGRDAAVFRNPFAVPRALVAANVAVAGDLSQEIAAVTEAAFDARSSAVVRGDELGADRSSVEAGAGVVRVVGEQNSRVTLHASLSHGGLVILDDAWAPGWSVEVDGHPARALQTDVVLRGVAVPAGEHEIVWSYRVPGLRAGALLSALGVLAFAAWGGWLAMHRRGRRRRRPPRGRPVS